MYRVIKTVKGYRYLYEQRSFREGGKVKTEARYLGRVDDPDSVITTAPVITAPADASRKTMLPAIPGAAGNDPFRPQFRIDCARYAISRHALEQEAKRHCGFLHRAGLDTSRLPDIGVIHGRAVEVKKAGGRYLVTLPPTGKPAGHRTAVKKAFSRALGYASLDLLRTQQPDSYGWLSLHLSKEYRDTTHALIRYALSSRYENRFAAVLSLQFFATFPQLRQWRHRGNKLEAQRVGLPDWGYRGDWEDEAATLLGEITRNGYSKTQRRWDDEERHAAAAERLAAERYLSFAPPDPRRYWARRDYKKAAARLQSCRAYKHKISLLGYVFRYSY